MRLASLTLVAGSKSPRMTDQEMDELLMELIGYPVCMVDQKWLSERKACDIMVEVDDLESLEPLVRNWRSAYDVALSWQDERRKKLLISDMDSTMVEEETLDILAAQYGLGAEIAAITLKSMNGTMDFEQSLRARVELLKGKKAAAAQATVLKGITLMPGGRTLVNTMADHGAFCALVSGGFTFATKRVRERIGFHSDYANQMEVEDGYFTGRLIDPILDRAAKARILEEQAARMNITAKDAVAVGDGANDLDMIGIAGMGVAYRGKDVVRKQSRYQVNHSDLTALLYFQGYSDSDFSELDD